MLQRHVRTILLTVVAGLIGIRLSVAFIDRLHTDQLYRSAPDVAPPDGANRTAVE